MSREDLVLKCIAGLFKGKYLNVSHSVLSKQPAGEIFGSGSHQDYPHITVSIENAGLDPQHSRVYYHSDAYFLKDMNSSTGTWIALGPAFNDHALDPNVSLKLGPVEFSIAQGPVQSLNAEVFTLFPSLECFRGQTV